MGYPVKERLSRSAKLILLILSLFCGLRALLNSTWKKTIISRLILGLWRPCNHQILALGATRLTELATGHIDRISWRILGHFVILTSRHHFL